MKGHKVPWEALWECVLREFGGQGPSQHQDPAAAQKAPAGALSSTQVAGLGRSTQPTWEPRACSGRGRVPPRACQLSRHRPSQRGRTKDMGAHATLTLCSPAHPGLRAARSRPGCPDASSPAGRLSPLKKPHAQRLANQQQPADQTAAKGSPTCWYPLFTHRIVPPGEDSISPSYG